MKRKFLAASGKKIYNKWSEKNRKSWETLESIEIKNRNVEKKAEYHPS